MLRRVPAVLTSHPQSEMASILPTVDAPPSPLSLLRAAVNSRALLGPHRKPVIVIEQTGGEKIGRASCRERVSTIV